MRGVSALLLILAAGAYPASAQTTFEQYEGKSSIQEGEGGTKIVKDGIEFWTSGSPPRRYQILGIINDYRLEDMLIPDAVGSRGTVKRIRAAGGDAAIVEVKERALADSKVIATDRNNFGTKTTEVRKDDTYAVHTRLIVIKYLPEEAH